MSNRKRALSNDPPLSNARIKLAGAREELRESEIKRLNGVVTTIQNELRENRETNDKEKQVFLQNYQMMLQGMGAISPDFGNKIKLEDILLDINNRFATMQDSLKKTKGIEDKLKTDQAELIEKYKVIVQSYEKSIKDASSNIVFINTLGNSIQSNTENCKLLAEILNSSNQALLEKMQTSLTRVQGMNQEVQNAMQNFDDFLNKKYGPEMSKFMQNLANQHTEITARSVELSKLAETNQEIAKRNQEIEQSQRETTAMQAGTNISQLENQNLSIQEKFKSFEIAVLGVNELGESILNIVNRAHIQSLREATKEEKLVMYNNYLSTEFGNYRNAMIQKQNASVNEEFVKFYNLNESSYQVKFKEKVLLINENKFRFKNKERASNILKCDFDDFMVTDYISSTDGSQIKAYAEEWTLKIRQFNEGAKKAELNAFDIPTYVEQVRGMSLYKELKDESGKEFWDAICTGKYEFTNEFQALRKYINDLDLMSQNYEAANNSKALIDKATLESMTAYINQAMYVDNSAAGLVYSFFSAGKNLVKKQFSKDPISFIDVKNKSYFTFINGLHHEYFAAEYFTENNGSRRLIDLKLGSYLKLLLTDKGKEGFELNDDRYEYIKSKFNGNHLDTLRFIVHVIVIHCRALIMEEIESINSHAKNTIDETNQLITQNFHPYFTSKTKKIIALIDECEPFYTPKEIKFGSVLTLYNNVLRNTSYNSALSNTEALNFEEYIQATKDKLLFTGKIVITSVIAGDGKTLVETDISVKTGVLHAQKEKAKKLFLVVGTLLAIWVYKTQTPQDKLGEEMEEVVTFIDSNWSSMVTGLCALVLGIGLDLAVLWDVVKIGEYCYGNGLNKNISLRSTKQSIATIGLISLFVMIVPILDYVRFGNNDVFKVLVDPLALKELQEFKKCIENVNYITGSTTVNHELDDAKDKCNKWVKTMELYSYNTTKLNEECRRILCVYDFADVKVHAQKSLDTFKTANLQLSVSYAGQLVMSSNLASLLNLVFGTLKTVKVRSNIKIGKENVEGLLKFITEQVTETYTAIVHYYTDADVFNANEASLAFTLAVRLFKDYYLILPALTYLHATAIVVANQPANDSYWEKLNFFAASDKSISSLENIYDSPVAFVAGKRTIKYRRFKKNFTKTWIQGNTVQLLASRRPSNVLDPVTLLRETWGITNSTVDYDNPDYEVTFFANIMQFATSAITALLEWAHEFVITQLALRAEKSNVNLHFWSSVITYLSGYSTTWLFSVLGQYWTDQRNIEREKSKVYEKVLTKLLSGSTNYVLGAITTPFGILEIPITWYYLIFLDYAWAINVLTKLLTFSIILALNSSTEVSKQGNGRYLNRRIKMLQRFRVI